MIRLKPGAEHAIKSFLVENNLQNRPVRIAVRFTGCCDPFLSLEVDVRKQSDLVVNSNGLILVVRPETHQLVGGVTVSLVNEPGEKRFVLTAEKPLSEWDGFGSSGIRVNPDAKEY